MESRIQEAKAALRQEVRRRLSKMAEAQRAAAAAQAQEALKSQSLWRAARAVLFYAPLPDELDIWPLLANALAAGKVAALPRFKTPIQGYVACQVLDLAHDIQVGHFGIREPGEHCAEIALNRLDLVLVPGVAFDLQGRRLGRGKGFYDRWLAAVRGTACGVAFDEQIVRRVPVAPHDAHVNCILTPTRWIELRERAVLE